jgi:CDP-2,3-bis-(O-geranylgeranyl)-sn-glycerol synthase
MDLILDTKLLLLLTAANGTPVVAQNLFGATLAHPVDGGAKLSDGQPLFGVSKTLRGIVLSLLATTIVGLAVGIGWQVAALVSTSAMAGDLMSSFIKRRMRLPPSSQATGLDQVPESLIPALVAAIFLDISMIDILLVVACFFGGALGISRVLYHFKLRNRPF